jgi:hypothetical protein
LFFSDLVADRKLTAKNTKKRRRKVRKEFSAHFAKTFAVKHNDFRVKQMPEQSNYFLPDTIYQILP